MTWNWSRKIGNKVMATTICTPCSHENNWKRSSRVSRKTYCHLLCATRSPQIHPMHHDTCFFDHEILRFNFLLFDVLVAIPVLKMPSFTDVWTMNHARKLNQSVSFHLLNTTSFINILGKLYCFIVLCLFLLLLTWRSKPRWDDEPTKVTRWPVDIAFADINNSKSRPRLEQLLAIIEAFKYGQEAGNHEDQEETMEDDDNEPDAKSPVIPIP